MGSQRTRKQKIDTKQFKVEINFHNQNKQKAEIEYSGNSGRALHLVTGSIYGLQRFQTYTVHITTHVA